MMSNTFPAIARAFPAIAQAFSIEMSYTFLSVCTWFQTMSNTFSTIAHAFPAMILLLNQILTRYPS